MPADDRRGLGVKVSVRVRLFHARRRILERHRAHRATQPSGTACRCWTSPQVGHATMLSVPVTSLVRSAGGCFQTPAGIPGKESGCPTKSPSGSQLISVPGVYPAGMKFNSLAVALAGVVLACGCGNPGPRRANPSAAAPEGVEHRTDEFAASSQTDLRERQAAWVRDGWSVCIVSGPITKPDGTVVRRAELTRVRQ
jgi:hypothetical protein